MTRIWAGASLLSLLLSNAGCSRNSHAAPSRAAPPVATGTAVAPLDEQRELLEILRRPLVYRAAGADKVRVQKGLAYKLDGKRSRHADVYLPPTAAGPVPVVVLVHGRARLEPPLMPREWGQYVGWGQALAVSGLGAVAFDHRLVSPTPRFSDGAQDLADLIAWLRSHAGELGLDGDRLCIAAFSGGGPLLAQPMRERPKYLRCLVAFYALLDARGDPRKLDQETVLSELSPLLELKPDAVRLPPLLVARAGREDDPELLGALDRFVQAALQHNAPLTLWNHPSGSHAFDIFDDDERSREIIAAAIAFMKQQLVP